MHCDKCGTEVAEQSAFCHKCGARLADARATVVMPRDKFPGTAGPRGDTELPAEKTLWEGSYSPKAMFGTWIVCAVVTLAAIVVGVIVIVAPPGWLIVAGVIAVAWLYPLVSLVYLRLSLHYRLTNQRFFHEYGILRRVTDRIEVIDMDDISFAQGLIERFVGTGTIQITSSDRTHPKLVLKGIDEVAKVAGLIDEARRAERLRRGVYVEAI
jgi:uncharacterized membrane protein YdbT with pleckstrin-like domain